MIQGILYRLDRDSCAILNAKLCRFELEEKKKDNVKQVCFVRLTVLNKIMKVKNELWHT